MHCCSAMLHTENVNSMWFTRVGCAQSWARTPLWKRAEYLHKVDGFMKANAQPIADCLVVEVSLSSRKVAGTGRQQVQVDSHVRYMQGERKHA